MRRQFKTGPAIPEDASISSCLLPVREYVGGGICLDRAAVVRKHVIWLLIRSDAPWERAGQRAESEMGPLRIG